MHRFYRTELLVGPAGIKVLQEASVILLGVGGVGSYAAEALARAGIGRMRIIDHDTVDLTNINRQLPALDSTVGQSKIQVVAERLKDINPDLDLEAIEGFYLPDRANELLGGDFTWVLDAVDTVTAKLSIITHCLERGQNVITSMGAGNKLDASQLKLGDISKTHTCPLARTIRKELAKRGIRSGLPVVWSPEPPLIPLETLTVASRRQIPGSISYVPPVAGLLMVSHVVNHILKN